MATPDELPCNRAGSGVGKANSPTTQKPKSKRNCSLQKTQENTRGEEIDAPSLDSLNSTTCCGEWE